MTHKFRKLTDLADPNAIPTNSGVWAWAKAKAAIIRMVIGGIIVTIAGVWYCWTPVAGKFRDIAAGTQAAQDVKNLSDHVETLRGQRDGEVTAIKSGIVSVNTRLDVTTAKLDAANTRLDDTNALLRGIIDRLDRQTLATHHPDGFATYGPPAPSRSDE